mgnify:CR=1 FL=1
MNINWSLLFTALGLAFVLEGASYFLFAERMEPMLKMLSEQPASTLRTLGFLALAAGLALVLIFRT